jgi:hypothetical protein
MDFVLIRDAICLQLFVPSLILENVKVYPLLWIFTAMMDQHSHQTCPTRLMIGS